MQKDITICQIGPDDLALLLATRDGLFDNAVDSDQAARFLADPGHEMVLAIAGGQPVGMASGTVVLHPDKIPSLFVNEVGVRDEWQRQGIATALLTRLFDIARARGCKGIWVATEPENVAARGLYKALKAEELPVICYGWDGAFDD